MPSSKIHMSRKNLATMMLLYLARIPEGTEDYERYNEIQLIMMGVIDGEGNLRDDYAGSDLWEVTDDGELKPSVKADIMSLIDPEFWPVVRG